MRPELWLCLAAAAAASVAPPVPAPAPPPLELLEFIGAWTDEEARDILDAPAPQARQTETDDANPDDAPAAP